jgi:hypothetical protein
MASIEESYDREDGRAGEAQPSETQDGDHRCTWKTQPTGRPRTCQR